MPGTVPPRELVSRANRQDALPTVYEPRSPRRGCGCADGGCREQRPAISPLLLPDSGAPWRSHGARRAVLAGATAPAGAERSRQPLRLRRRLAGTGRGGGRPQLHRDGHKQRAQRRDQRGHDHRGAPGRRGPRHQHSSARVGPARSRPAARSRRACRCTVPSLAPSGTATFTVRVSPFGGPPGTPLTNVSSVSSTTPDPNPANNAATTTTTLNPGSNVGASADIAVTKTGPAGPRLVGQNVVYTVAVTNDTGGNSPGPVLSDPIPPNTTFVSAVQTSGPAFACTTAVGAAGAVVCVFDGLFAVGSGDLHDHGAGDGGRAVRDRSERGHRHGEWR